MVLMHRLLMLEKVCGWVCVCTVLLLIPGSPPLWYIDILDDVGVRILRQRLAVAQILLNCRNVLVSWRKRLVLGRRLGLVIGGFWDFVPFNCKCNK